MGDALLTTVVLGLGAVERSSWRRRDSVEELVHPLGELAGLDAIGDNSKVGLGVGRGSKVGNGVGVKVLAEGNRGRWGRGDTEASVEGKAVGGVEGELLDAGEQLLLVELDDGLNLLVEDVGCGKGGERRLVSLMRV